MFARSRAIDRTRLAGVAVAALVAICALPASAPADPPTLGCRYVEAGAPGPVGNLLEIDGTGSVAIGRDGQQITVSLAKSIGIRTERTIECVGAVPTVTTVDRIAYSAPADLGQVLIDERGGRFEPGATDEPGGDEIEIFVELPRVNENYPNVHVLGRPGADLIKAGNLTRDRIGVNLDWGRDRTEKDADLIVTCPRGAVLKIDGYGGSDRLSGGGGREFAGSLWLSALVLMGGDGDDLLGGGPGNDHIEGDEGSDIVIARGGDDQVYAGAGRDRVLAGRGNDWIFGARGNEDDFQFDLYVGGAGDDYISSRYGGRDRVFCQGGIDEVWVDPFDSWDGDACDKVRIAAH